MYLDREKLLVIGSLVFLVVILALIAVDFTSYLQLEYIYIAVFAYYVYRTVSRHLIFSKCSDMAGPLKLTFLRDEVDIYTIIDGSIITVLLAVLVDADHKVLNIAMIFIAPLLASISKKINNWHTFGISERGILFKRGYHDWEDFIGYRWENDKILIIEVKHRFLFIIYNKEITVRPEIEEIEIWNSFLTSKLNLNAA